MQLKQKQTSDRGRFLRGFTIIELLVVIAIIVLLVSLLVPTLGKALRSARSTEDRTQAKGIYSAMLLYASSNEGKLPRPSFIRNNFEPDVTDDTTANLMSVMIGRNFFASDYVISPVESNPNVIDISEDGILTPKTPSCPEQTDLYDFCSINGETVFWDETFNADVENATASSPAHNSYAHLALVGDRIRQKWHNGAGTSDIIISNRGPRDGVIGTGFDASSYTLKFHSSESTWNGVIVTGDGSARLANSVLPEGIAYQPINGLPLGPDNIFSAEWNDLPQLGAPVGMPSGDNWLVICNQVMGNNELTAVWD